MELKCCVNNLGATDPIPPYVTTSTCTIDHVWTTAGILCIVGAVVGLICLFFAVAACCMYGCPYQEDFEEAFGGVQLRMSDADWATARKSKEALYSNALEP